MLRAAINLPESALHVAPWVERAEVKQNLADRWLLGIAGRISVATSGLSVWRLRKFAASVIALEDAYSGLSEQALQQRVAGVSSELRRSGLRGDVVANAFALVREASVRAIGKRHYDVQIIGGRVMLDGRFAEMQTGEGKTLTALLPAATMALAGVPVHVVTVNEYLAERDANQLEPVYQLLGLSVGKVLPEQSPAERALAYGCRVTYCVNKDLTFDYLRDRIETLSGRHGARAQLAGLGMPHTLLAPPLTKGLWYALIDEADSVFVDEARTPLIISRSGSSSAAALESDGALALAKTLQEQVHFKVVARDRHVELLDAGKQVLQHCQQLGLPNPKIQRERLLAQALTALHCYALDRHYIVADGKIEIVDEFTGRVMPDRAWEGGLHQMIERKEGLQATAPRETSARITYQRLFRRYLRLGGMSGTLSEASGELKAVLGVRVVRVPTYRPVLRKSLPTRLFASSQQRDAAVVASAAAMVAGGRAVLIGTRSVAASERIASLCRVFGLDPTLLNARQDADEAGIVSRAGQPGQLTVATNMAGRGTDITLAPSVLRAGGLHVILTEFHESKRIDRQLVGRAGRQGDPGSWQALVSLDDEIFTSQAPSLARWLGGRFPTEMPRWIATGLRWLTQAAAERQHAETRRNTLAQEQRTDQMLAFAGRPE